MLLSYVSLIQQAYETVQNNLGQNKVLLSINLIDRAATLPTTTITTPTKSVTEKQPAATETSTKVETTTSAETTQTTKTPSTLKGVNSFAHELRTSPQT